MILPGATLGLLGGGQLGRMFTTRARSMGYEVWVLDPDPQSPAGRIASRHLCSSYADPTALQELAAACSAVTTEFENVPAEALQRLAEAVRVRPGWEALAVAQDRDREKTFLTSHGIPTAPFAPVRTPEDFGAALDTVGTPALLKTCRLGYDGKGQIPVDSLEELTHGFAALGMVPCVLEQRLDLHCEVSVVLARDDAGNVRTFPIGENVHRHGILETTTVPASVPDTVATQVLRHASAIARHLEYVGVLGVEFFIDRAGQVYANEIAPRPHNSGHYTSDACSVSQFEQQIRALCRLPLAVPRLLTPVCMVNLLGDLWEGGPPPWERVLDLDRVVLHLYGKAEPRPGRKMGHLNCLADTAAEAFETAHRALSLLQVGARAGSVE